MASWVWFHKLGSPKHFYALSEKLLPWFAYATAITLAISVYGAFSAPPDYQQGQSYRIMFIHVPSAWMSLFIYVVMAVSAAIALIWKIKVTDLVAGASAQIGASFTFLTLCTGSIWGRPMWGTWWAWDARLTSELILLFLFIGYIALRSSFEDRAAGAKASAVLAMVGLVNVPIIHFSVQWWNTLHQPPSVSKFGMPSIDPSMLWPLLLMAVALKLFYITVLLMRVRCEVLDRERGSPWVQELALAENGGAVQEAKR